MVKNEIDIPIVQIDGFPTSNINAIYVPVEHILLTHAVYVVIKKIAKEKLFYKDPYPSGFPLSLDRIYSIMNAMLENIPLDAIHVKLIKTYNGNYYSIIDGRHRFACSILLCKKTIPIVIQ
jgi:hypothetical protein